jgi:hypothetical protein
MLRANPMFPESYIRDRWKELLRLFDTFKPAYERKNGSSIILSIDEVALYQAVASYFHDVARYKFWHFPKEPEKHRVDESKKSAFMVHWLNRIRPIHVDRPTTDPAALAAALANDTSLMVNAQFALVVAFSYLNIVLAPNVLDEFLYILTYRATDSNALIMIFKMVDEVRHGRSIII